LTSDEIKKLRKLGNDKILIFKKGNHGLETNNMAETKDFHKAAVSRIIDFIEQ